MFLCRKSVTIAQNLCKILHKYCVIHFLNAFSKKKKNCLNLTNFVSKNLMTFENVFLNFWKNLIKYDEKFNPLLPQ